MGKQVNQKVSGKSKATDYLAQDFSSPTSRNPCPSLLCSHSRDTSHPLFLFCLFSSPTTQDLDHPLKMCQPLLVLRLWLPSQWLPLLLSAMIQMPTPSFFPGPSRLRLPQMLWQLRTSQQPRTTLPPTDAGDGAPSSSHNTTSNFYRGHYSNGYK